MTLLKTFFGLGISLSLLACAGKSSAPKPTAESPKPYESSYSVPSQSGQPGVWVLSNVEIWTGLGTKIPQGRVVVSKGKIMAIGGASLPIPEGAVVQDGQGKILTPGIIDMHSHLGVYAAPEVWANEDGNEMTSPVTAEVWAEHSIWPQDPQFQRARAGGVTSMLILPGSANLVGGRGVVVKNVPSRSVAGMKFPNAPHSLKMACGENPKRVYGSKGSSPSTRMGNFAGYRRSWIEALDYQKKLKSNEVLPEHRDLRLETLAKALSGEILIQIHCYRADEMMHMIELSKEFGYKIAAFHHAVESYKIADELAKACAVVHSDSPEGIQRLNQEAAKAWTRGKEMGFDLKPEEVIAWITSNPAKAIGIDAVTGSLVEGKAADLVLWDGHPLSVYGKAQKVWVDGTLTFDRERPAALPESDFELGVVHAK